MDEAAQAVAKALAEAVKAESDGHSFYKMAALSSQDDKGRQIFDQLAEEELDHKRFLMAQYKAIRSTGRIWSATPNSVAALGIP